MNLVTIQSSNISQIGFEENVSITLNQRPRNVLRIVFTSGDIFDYYNVEKDDYERFLDAKSKGSYFHKFIKGVYVFEKDIPFYWRTRLAIADYTGDGLEDIIGLNGIKNLVLYERYRKETGELRLRHGRQIFYNNGSPIKKPHYFKMRNVDWNGDGLMDIIVTQNLFSSDQRSLLFLKNVGTKEMPVFEQPVALKMWGKVIRYSSHGLQPSLIDWEGDGSLDFVGCNESGLFVLFRNAALNYPKPKVHVGSPLKMQIK